MKTRFAAYAAIAVLSAIPMVGPGTSSPSCAASPKDPPVSFQEDILPVFQIRCVSCHSPNGEGFKASGMDLTSYAGVMKGTKFGPMIIPGDPDASNLMRLIDWKAGAELRMPHNAQKRLSICDRNTIRAWIREGAKDN